MGKFDQPNIKNALNNQESRPALYSIKDAINSKDRFIINKLTDNGAYVKGDMIVYNINGVEIYAPLDKALNIDLVSKTVIITSFNEIMEETVDPETRNYLLLLMIPGKEDEFIWCTQEGRTAAYEYIVRNIDIYQFDPDNSYILTSNVKLKEAFTIKQFVNHLKNANLIPEDDFNIDDYVIKYPEDYE